METAWGAATSARQVAEAGLYAAAAFDDGTARPFEFRSVELA